MKATWRTAQLGNFLRIQNGFAFDSTAFNPSEGLPLIRIRDLKDGFKTETRFSGDYDKRYLVNAGDLLIAMDGEFGCYEWRGEAALLNQRVCRLEGFDSKLLPRFVLYGLNAHLKSIEDATSFATVKHLSSKQVLGIDFPIPPLPEQRRIVGILHDAFAGLEILRANAERNLQNARALFESCLNAVFTETGEGWVDTTLGAEIDLLAGFAFKSAKYTASNDSIKLLRGDNIIQGSLRWDDVKKWPKSDTLEYGRYQLRVGDVVLAMDRPWVKAGLKHAMISDCDLPCLLVQRTARLRSGPWIENRYLMYLIGCDAFARHILGVQTGIGVPHISGQQIQDFSFYRPPLIEQRRIADKLESLHEYTKHLESIYQQKLCSLAKLKQSILQKAFAGELTSVSAKALEDAAP